MRINLVTITGADDSINPEELIALSNDYPFVEWGILLSRSSAGKNRFPSSDWIKKLYDVTERLTIRFSGHICGSWTREILMGNAKAFEELAYCLPMFNRLQINTHAEMMSKSMGGFREIFKSPTLVGKQIIVQWDKVNGHDLLLALATEGIANAAPLYDMSHGLGKTPGRWPQRLARPHGNWEPFYCGYAGGLGEDNLQSEVDRIRAVVENDVYAEIGRDVPIWIDMETKVRSTDDAQFDIGKVSRVLEIASTFVK